MVDEELFNGYRTALGASADMAKTACEQLVAQYSGTLTKSELAEVYAALVRKLGQYAAQVALEFYEQLREQADPEEQYTPKTFEPDNSGLLTWDANNMSYAQLPGIAAQRVLQYADETVIRNARADPAHPRYVMVPHAGACGWCILTALQGMYSRHPNCRCSVEADFNAGKDVGVGEFGSYEEYEGYAYRLYKRANSNISADAWEKWNAMSKAEQAKYKRSYHNKSAMQTGVYDVYKRNRLVAEINRLSGYSKHAKQAD